MLRTSYFTAALALAPAASAQANTGAEPAPTQTLSASTPAATDIQVFVRFSEKHGHSERGGIGVRPQGARHLADLPTMPDAYRPIR